MARVQFKQFRGWFVTVLGGLLWLAGDIAVAQVRNYTPGEYPAPRTPNYNSDATAEDLLPIARTLVRKPSLRQPLEPGYGIRPGERVLILVSSTFDDRVLEAISRAIAEVGGRADIMKTYAAPRGKATANHGHGEVRLPGEPAQYGGGGTSDIRRDLVALGKYNLLVNGSGGPVPTTPFRWEYIPWDTVDKFMFSQAGFPYEVQKALDDKLWQTLLRARKVRVTDPEGTAMSWNWKPNYAGMVHEEWPHYEGTLTGHIGSFPQFLSPADAEANGTIGGTINHTGTFPRILLTLRNNEIVKIDGGGEYGEKWKQMLELCRGTQFPGFPAPGCGWFEEAAVGTDVWRARGLEIDEYAGGASWERGRAGVIHFGLGVARNVTDLPAVAQWMEQNQPVTTGHWHIHTYFNTMDFNMEDGKQIRVIEKGRLTFLDDPDVRRIAAKYGNPDEILNEKWIPAIPGINVPGNYLTDYAPDPYKVIAKQQTELRNKVQASRR